MSAAPPPTVPTVPPPFSRRQALASALALALGAAVSLGLARFAYTLLLPAMRADLGWRYATAGAMNTVNAAGYLAGALAMPWLLRRLGPRVALLGGSAALALLLAAHAWPMADGALYALRAAMGAGSAAVFVAGGLLAARLSLQAPPGLTPGLLLGLYYGGIGLGILASALGLPALTAWLPAADPSASTAAAWPAWRWGWLGLGVLAALATVLMARHARVADAGPAAAGGPPARLRWAPLAPALAAYTGFGLGYIGYMTFIVTRLREQGLGAGAVSGFYALLGAAVVASPWLWAGLLQRHRGGRPLALLCALLALATALPVLHGGVATALVSGALFGAVFVSAVASTTALVRHNLPPAAWPAGISAFTIVFAAGQIVGPVAVGWLSDGAGGLGAGLLASAAVLAGAAALALAQRPLATEPVSR